MRTTVTNSDQVICQPASILRPAYRVAALALLVLISAEILLSSRQESQTSDEANHLYAGYEYWKHGDFGRNPEHPPLVKLIAASALLRLRLSEPNDPYPNFKSSDFNNAAKFLYSADADMLLARGRAMLLIFSLGLALAVFAAGREMFGPEAGLLAMTLFCLEPTLLANGGQILTDMALSCLLFLSVYTFYRYVKRPTPGRLLLCAATVGLTLTSKHSGALVLPILTVVAIADAAFERIRAGRSSPSRARGPMILWTAFGTIAIVSFAIVWAFYGFRYAARPAGLAMLPTLQTFITAVPDGSERAVIKFCAQHRLLPEAYLYGWADILQIRGTRVSFILGKLRPASWWFGFPVLIALKTTIPLIVLLLLVPFAAVWRRTREFLYLALPAAVYLFIAMISKMNAAVRYIEPIYPFCIVLAGAAAWEMARRSRRWAIAIAALMAFAAGTSLRAFPDYLAYANEAFGGSSQSHRLIADADGDGGQGLKWVKSYLDTNHISDCWFDYINPWVDPKYYRIPCKPLVSSAVLSGAPWFGQVPPTITGTVLISATEMASHSLQPDALNPYAQFFHLRPDALVGNVVLVYHGSFDVPLLSAYSHSLTAKRLAGEGRMNEAVAEAEEAVQLVPNSAAIQEKLGETLMQAGRNQEGQKANAEALRLARATYPESQQELIRFLEIPGMTGPPAR